MTSPEAERLAGWLSGADSNDRRLTEAWTIVKAWRDGAMPRTQTELLQWAVTLTRSKQRAKRLIVATDALTAVLCARMEASGMSGREIARALGIKPTPAHRLVVRGREILAGQTDDGVPPASPVGSDESI